MLRMAWLQLDAGAVAHGMVRRCNVTYTGTCSST